MNSVAYSIKCPKCSAQATARMHPVGRSGTYREPMIRLGVRRIVCGVCGFSEEVPPERCDAYELWYAMTFKRQRLWARNRRHLTFLISWFSGEMSKAEL